MSVTHAWTVSVFEVAVVSIGGGVPRGLIVRKTVVFCVVSNKLFRQEDWSRDVSLRCYFEMLFWDVILNVS